MDIHEFKAIAEEYGDVVAKLRINELVIRTDNMILFNQEISAYPEVLRLINRNAQNEYLFANIWIMHPEYHPFIKDVNFSVNTWRTLLSNRPEYFDHCPCVDKFTREQWLGIIRNKNNLMKYFPFWDSITNDELYKLVPYHRNLAHLLDFDCLTDTETFHLFLQNDSYHKALRMDKVDYACIIFSRQIAWAAKEPETMPLNTAEIRLLRHAATLEHWDAMKENHPRFRLLDQLSK